MFPPPLYLMASLLRPNPSPQITLERSPTGLQFTSQLSHPLHSELEPFVVTLSKNQVLNRLLIELLGYTPWVIALARSQYERYEKVLEEASWIFMGVLGPVLLDKLLKRGLTKQLRKAFNLSQTANMNQSPLNLPYEALDPILSSEWIANLKNELKNTPQKLSQFGLENLDCLNNPAFRKRIWQGKLWILFADLALMAFHGQAYAWGKNWLTESLSKRKGFSGIFNQVDATTQREKSKVFAKTEEFRKVLALSFAISNVFALPLILKSVLSNNGTGFLSRLKPYLTQFNYHNSMYMPKSVIFWGCLFNYNLAMTLSSRDRNELRENILKSIVFDFFFFLGDQMLSGQIAHFLQKRYSALQEGLQGESLVHYKPLWKRWTLPLAKAPHELFKTAFSQSEALAYKLSKRIFWLGLISTSLFLGIGMTAINNCFTRYKVAKEYKQNA